MLVLYSTRVSAPAPLSSMRSRESNTYSNLRTLLFAKGPFSGSHSREGAGRRPMAWTRVFQHRMSTGTKIPTPKSVFFARQNFKKKYFFLSDPVYIYIYIYPPPTIKRYPKMPSSHFACLHPLMVGLVFYLEKGTFPDFACLEIP